MVSPFTGWGMVQQDYQKHVTSYFGPSVAAGQSRKLTLKSHNQYLISSALLIFAC